LIYDRSLALSPDRAASRKLYAAKSNQSVRNIRDIFVRYVAARISLAQRDNEIRAKNPATYAKWRGKRRVPRRSSLFSFEHHAEREAKK